jgi:hypothetical protein
MESTLEVRCRCGTLRGALRADPAKANRCVCYCDDCQAFANWLGRASDLLDAHGGTDIFQTSPARLDLSAGEEQLACMRLTERGLLRWYAKCCNTPIGNTLAARRIPFVGIVSACVEPGEGRSLDDVLGPVRARVQGRFATGDRSQIDAHDRAPAAMLLRFVGLLLAAGLRGEAARSPFFDARSGAPRAAPQVLDAEELARVHPSR